MPSTFNTTGDQWKAAAGYLAIAIAPLLLGVGASIGKPYFAVGTVLVVFTLARLVFGPYEGPPPWTERVSWWLDRLPLLYAVLLAATMGYLLSVLARDNLSPGDIAGWSLSLWVTLTFATCVAHDLLHRRSKDYRVAGHVLAGIAGYPVLGYDHSRHHARPGNTAAAEWPRIDESVWQFSARRLPDELMGCSRPSNERRWIVHWRTPEPPSQEDVGMLHFYPHRAAVTPCWHCSRYVGMLYARSAARCQLQPAVRSQPAHGCAFFEREPGADDELGPPVDSDLLVPLRA